MRTWVGSGYIIHGQLAENPDFARVLGVFARLGKIGVGGFQHGILVAMAVLPGHRCVGFLPAPVLLDCTLAGVFVPAGQSRKQLRDFVGIAHIGEYCTLSCK